MVYISTNRGEKNGKLENTIVLCLPGVHTTMGYDR